MHSYKDILKDIGVPLFDIKSKKDRRGYLRVIPKDISTFTHLMTRVSSIEDVSYGMWFCEEIKNSDITNKETLLSCIEDNSIIEYDINIPPKKEYTFTFADIFCNSGGATMGLMQEGGRCVFAYDENPQVSHFSYFQNFGIFPYSNTDVLKDKAIPKVDILITSLDIQSLPLNRGAKPNYESLVETQWYTFIEFVKKFQPKAVIIECNKTQRDESLEKSTAVAYRTLKEATGYYCTSPAILNALNYGVPQLRNRLWFVAFSNPLSALNFDWPEPEKRTWKLKDILESSVNSNLYLTRTHELYLEKNNAVNKERGYWYSSIILDPEAEAKSISYGGQGWDRNLIYDEKNAPTKLEDGKEVNHQKLRRLSSRELLRLQGFPEEFELLDIWRARWEFMGMATNVNVAQRVARSVLKSIDEENIKKSAKILINSGINF